MTIEERLTELLERKAGDIAAVPDREDLVARRESRRLDTTVLPLTPAASNTGQTTRTRVLQAIAAAVVLVVPVVLFVVLRSSSGVDDAVQVGDGAPPAEAWLDRDVYPRFNGSSPFGDVYGTFAVPGTDTPRVTSVVVGRRDGDRWTDVNTISVSQPGIDFQPEGATTEQTQLGGKQVTKYSWLGQTWFRWQLGDAVVTINAGIDADVLLADLIAEPATNGNWPVLQLGPLPAGLEVISGPDQNQFDPLPGIATDSGAGPGFDLYVYPSLELPMLPTDYDAVSVRGAPGLLADIDGAQLLVWPVDGDAWAHLSVRGGDGDEALGVANAVDFVGRARWETHYDESVDSYRSAPTTTAAKAPTASTTVASGPPSTWPVGTTTCAALEGRVPVGIDDVSFDPIGLLTYRVGVDGVDVEERLQVFDDGTCTADSEAWRFIVRPVLDPDRLRREGILCDIYTSLVVADAEPANTSTVLDALGGRSTLADECA